MSTETFEFFRGIKKGLPAYDAVEVQPCKEIHGIVEVCDDSETPDMWSIYLHCVTGGAMCIIDIPGGTDESKNLAYRVAESIYKDLESYQGVAY